MPVPQSSMVCRRWSIGQGRQMNTVPNEAVTTSSVAALRPGASQDRVAVHGPPPSPSSPAPKKLVAAARTGAWRPGCVRGCPDSATSDRSPGGLRQPSTPARFQRAGLERRAGAFQATAGSHDHVPPRRTRCRLAAIKPAEFPRSNMADQDRTRRRSPPAQTLSFTRWPLTSWRMRLL